MAKVNWEIENFFDAKCIREMSVAVNGNSYLVIFGTHINGGFCCIPGWSAGCELSSHDHFGDVGYNADRIGKALKNKTVGRCIAEAINIVASYKDERRN